MKFPKKKKIVITLLASTVALFFLCNTLVVINAKGKCYDDVTLIPHNKVGLLLGTLPKLVRGESNAYFDNRINTAVSLYKAGKIDYVLASGDNRKAGYNEPEEMKKALVAQGIPAEKIVLDYAGFRTLDSIVRANMVFGQSNITIISQKFHNQRALYLCKHNNIEAIAMNAPDVPFMKSLKMSCREKLARVRMFLDLIVNKQPKFLGEKIEIK